MSEIELELANILKQEIDNENYARVHALCVSMTAIKEKQERERGCTWTLVDEYCNEYETDCGHIFSLNTDTPSENGMRFCCYCGKDLRKEVQG